MKSLVLWSEKLLEYDLGNHPLDPVRVELTIALARDLGLLDRPGVTVREPVAATDEELLRVHRADYLHAVRVAPDDPFFRGYGLNTPDNPVFDHMHEASALVAGASLAAARAVYSGEVTRAVNVSGGLHHAMPARASGFCVYNDPAIAIADLLAAGAQRIAYVDIDVHHGDGVQEIFADDPRVLTVSLHESPMTLFPGTGFPTEVGGPAALGTAVNVALPPGTRDRGWLRAFHAVVPSVLRAFRPQLVVLQAGADSHQLDPLANLQLSVDGQRAAAIAVRDLADELCGGKVIATGGGGYALMQVVPRTWSHLIATMTGDPLDPATLTPPSWRALARKRFPDQDPPQRMTDDADVGFEPWQPGVGQDPLDRTILATRQAIFPYYGLDPMDARD
ncbi:acetoin utilization protein AcuC [Rhizocola hellebori]|uniref:acetoin utilization protein AcuC n=1 Tax=Rhizocola hellebori TaxID=1392758 RepID=UPI001943F027|nr:acetoin utilization protein AcuC [Rhizocola hellebori]